MMSDFHMGTEIASFDIGKVQTITKLIELPSGYTDMRFVAREYDCAQPLDGLIDLTITSAAGKITQHDVWLNKLTWPRDSKNCIPIGYLRSDDENMTRPLKLEIKSDDNPIIFRLEVKQVAGASKQMSIWVVYNDRDPVDRMLTR
jgi:hypothetical protein